MAAIDQRRVRIGVKEIDDSGIRGCGRDALVSHRGIDELHDKVRADRTRSYLAGGVEPLGNFVGRASGDADHA